MFIQKNIYINNKIIKNYNEKSISKERLESIFILKIL